MFAMNLSNLPGLAARGGRTTFLVYKAILDRDKLRLLLLYTKSMSTICMLGYDTYIITYSLYNRSWSQQRPVRFKR